MFNSDPLNPDLSATGVLRDRAAHARADAAECREAAKELQGRADKLLASADHQDALALEYAKAADTLSGEVDARPPRRLAEISANGGGYGPI